MITNLLKIFALAFIVVTGLALPGHTEKTADIVSTYLTWDNEDTATTMVVNILSLIKPKNPILHYGTAVQMMNGQQIVFNPTDVRPITGTPIYITRFSLKNLSPDTMYFFNYKDETHTLPKELSFKTLPATNKPVEFVQGGDMSASTNVETVGLQAITNDTMALLIGGDVAYEDGKLSNFKLWLKWFSIMNRTMKTPNGRLIPLLVSVGNHEVNTQSSTNFFVRAPFFMNLFLQNGQPYFKRALGPHTTVFSLDSGHLSTHSGAQRDWLEAELANTNTENKFAQYHVPMYPTYRDYEGSLSAAARKHWLPLFDKYELTAGFENHDHTLKRTHMLRGNAKVMSGGTVYVGDGCWGVGSRTADKRWYHAVAESKRHTWRVVAHKDAVQFSAIGQQGEILDQFIIEKKQVTEVSHFKNKSEGKKIATLVN
ncbi:MAG: metallophosphoesterase family protein [Bdellovibrionaceae bacterium]|nr:metallophosphoesterase family protein [Pseudobdellovibrionaceae bacterium]